MSQLFLLFFTRENEGLKCYELTLINTLESFYTLNNGAQKSGYPKTFASSAFYRVIYIETTNQRIDGE